MKKFLFTMAFLAALSSCNGQNQKEQMTNKAAIINPLLCDTETGICGIPGQEEKGQDAGIAVEKKIKVIYFTDPICSSCWGIEPQLRKLKLEYGDALDIEYRMGGLLPDWSYNSGSISKPSDVAHHWDEVSLHYDMPIDGDVWLEDPLDSSFPPSIAFKAAQLQDGGKSILFLRELREMVFIRKKNIAKWENISQAAANVGLDIERLKSDIAGSGKLLFDQDLQLARNLGVRGFPTMFFVSQEGKNEKVYGSKPYAAYEQAVKGLDSKLTKKEYNKDWKSLFAAYPSLTRREFSELAGVDASNGSKLLADLEVSGKLQVVTTKNGNIWTAKQSTTTK